MLSLWTGRGIGWRQESLALQAAQKDLATAQPARDALEADAKDQGNILDMFGSQSLPQRAYELHRRYVEKAAYSKEHNL